MVYLICLPILIRRVLLIRSTTNTLDDLYFQIRRYSLLREIKEQILERIFELLLRIHNWCLNYSLVCLLIVNLIQFGIHWRSQASFLCFQDFVLDCVGLYKVGWLFVWFGFRIILIRGSLHRFNWLSFYLSSSFIFVIYSAQFRLLQFSPNSRSCLWSFVSRCC